MRIAVTGTNGVGKSTLISDILDHWDCYSKPEKSYRDLIEDRYTTVTEESRQQLILDNMVDQLKTFGKDENIIIDRCPVDNVVYSLYGNNQGNISDDFISKSAARLKDALRMIDLILFIPVTSHDSVDIEANLQGKGDLNAAYAVEIDNIFKTLYRQWESRESPFVDFEDKPHIVEIFGSRQERLELIKMYITETGGAFESSVILSPDEIVEMESLYAAIAKEPIENKKSPFQA